MDLKLNGKVALVTGGSEGIGLETALRLTREGARVAILSRSEEKLRRAADHIRQEAGTAPLTISADVSDAEACARAVAQVAAQLGGLDILINNAGAAGAVPFEAVADDTWLPDMNLKLLGAVRCSRAAIPHMKQAGGGAIVNVTAIAGKAPGAGSLPSSVSRAAGLALTKAMSRDLGPEGIRVNAVCIGLIRSAQIERGWQKNAPDLTWEQYSARMGKSWPLGRIGDTAEAANVITFLASGAASYVTGTAVNVDGGSSPVL
ncbi:MAG: short-chain dehydrogenase [Firmicutes bacterium]|nr:short-chain dehydrogenase [Bacillota bacterium]